jgi:hypothetical protein
MRVRAEMSEKPKLKLDWCSHEAAKYAVEHWHYSRCMPKSKLAKIGVWEDEKFIGAVIFGVGATADLVKMYGLESVEGCELVRVALTSHKSAVSKIVAIAIKMLKKEMTGLRLIVSFADPEHGHNGTIYQAGNWIYAGDSQSSEEYIINGKRWHGRAFRASKPSHLTTKQAAALMDPNYQVVMGSSKYRYLMPLDNAMKKQVEPLRKPYPKRDPGETDNAAGSNLQTGGARPTGSLLEC